MTYARRLLVMWNQFWCAYQHGTYHGTLYRDRNRLAVFCRGCGFESSGIELETRRVRTLWMFDKHRQRWQGMRRLAC